MNYLKTIRIVLGLMVLISGTVAVNAGNETVASRDDVKSEVRNVAGFTGVDIGGTIRADVTVGENFKVVVEAKESVLPKVITKVEDNVLKVNFEKSWWKKLTSGLRNEKVRVTISLPSLDDLDVSGASKVNVAGVNSEKLTIDVSGASSVSIEGNAREIEADLSGASNLRAEKLVSETIEMDLSGASSAKVNVSNELRVDASGASSVRYTGEPRVSKDTSGASSVKRM